jgi:oligoribonuclease NrnB/cAMP/cGMP phosphodiesterase (DHH superfamily)
VLAEMADRVEWLIILDHHKTAEVDLADFAAAPFDSPGPDYEIACGRKIVARFDMTKSGAVLAWEFCHGVATIPSILAYIQDRDLWKFLLPRSREIAACIFSYPYDFQTWDWLAARMELTIAFEEMAADGEAIERKHKKDIVELLSQTVREMTIGGIRVLVANIPYTMSSDAANDLAEGAPFGACYFDRNDGWRVFSLRSKTNGADVSEIARKYGGGGHRHAAGFQMPTGWEGESVLLKRTGK